MKSWMKSLTLLVSVLALGGLPLASTLAHAQIDPETGDTGQWQPPPPAQPQPPPPQVQPQPQPQANAWQQQPPPAAAQQPAWLGSQPERPPAMGGEQPGVSSPAGGDDHSQLVGHLGVSLFGVENLTAGVTAAGHSVDIHAPTIGIRTWLSDSLAFEAGLGLGIGSISTSKETTGDSVVLPGLSSVFALGLHVGLPVALAHSGHFAALLIPEIDFGYGSAKRIVNPGDADQDITLSTIDFKLGVRIGGEVHFGFWGLPQLSLQGTVGLGIQYRSGSAADSVDLPAGGIGESESKFSVTTFANDIVNGMIRINYYF